MMLNWIIWNRTDYLYKRDLALNNLQKTNKQINKSFKSKITYKLFTYKSYLVKKKKKKVGDLSRGLPEGSLYNSYYTEV